MDQVEQAVETKEATKVEEAKAPAELVAGGGTNPLLKGFRNKTVILPISILQEKIEKLEKLVSGGFQEIQERNQQSLQYTFKSIAENASHLKEMAYTLEAVIKLLGIDEAKIDEMETKIKEEKAAKAEADADAKNNRKVVARASQTGDVVKIDFVGKIDGTAFPGGTGKNQHLTLGSNQFIPGFEDQLVGLSAGETKVVKVTFPADYGNAELAGKDAEFETTVVSVKEVAKKEAAATEATKAE